MAILADVAPYSREYNTFRQIVGKEAQGNTELEIEYEKILNRVKQTRESVIKMTDRHFTAPVDEISGTIEEATPHGISLKEYPGRIFQFSSVSTSAADMSARILGEDQVSSSLRTQKPSRVRDKPRAPSMSPGPLRSWLAHPGHGRQAQVVSSSCRPHKPLRARRQAEAPSSQPSTSRLFLAFSSSIYRWIGLFIP
jgi:hypothetical protein